MPIPFRAVATALSLVLVCYVVYWSSRTGRQFASDVYPQDHAYNSSRSLPNVFLHEMIPADEIVSLETNFDGLPDRRLLNDLARRWLVAPSRLPRTLSKPTLVDHSQLGQSLVVDHQLNQRRNGFFVECGAGNGEHLSNSLYFETARNWTGLLVEAHPMMFKKMLRLNRKAYTINACLGATNRTGTFPFRLAAELGGLVAQHLRNANTLDRIIDAQCFNLYSIMLAIGKTHIDYFSLDVEGAEMQILRTIPFDKLTIDIFTIEYRTLSLYRTRKKLVEMRAFFKKLGNYVEVGIIPKGSDDKGLDVVFKRV